MLGVAITLAAAYYYYHDYLSSRFVGYYAAGVLPVAYDPSTARMYMLLGHDGFRDSWSDFSGGRDFAEVDPTLTACREFMEETSGVVADVPSAAVCLQLLEQKDVMKSILYSQKKKSSFIHYVINVTFDPSIPDRFARRQSEIRYRAEASFLEKTKIAWVDIEEFRSTLRPNCDQEKVVYLNMTIYSSFLRLLCKDDKLVGTSLLSKLESKFVFSDDSRSRSSQVIDGIV